MSLYDIFLDDLVSKSKGKLHRDETDRMITQASEAANMSKWNMLIAFSEVYPAYAEFEASMQTLESGRGISESELSQVRENILQMAEEEII